MTLDCLIIADDLTGACDAAVHFAVRGRRTAVCLGADCDASGATVIAISTDSRDAKPEKIRPLMEEVARQFPISRSCVLFKKIDSTLRGNAGFEIAEAHRAFGCSVSVITPAFPAMGRIVEAGHLRTAGLEPIELAAHFRRQGLDGCSHAVPDAILEAIEAGAHLVTVDATCDRDLDAIVAEVLNCNERVLWAGSAGLAAALARALPQGPFQPEAASHSGPALFCIGSDHPVTVEQTTNLIEQRAALVLRLSREFVLPDRLRELAGRTGALVLSGGDTASFVCRALGVRRIDLAAEIAPGIPRGFLRGGPLDGVPVVTKSGGFGGPDALIQVADFFQCPKI